MQRLMIFVELGTTINVLKIIFEDYRFAIRKGGPPHWRIPIVRFGVQFPSSIGSYSINVLFLFNNRDK